MPSTVFGQAIREHFLEEKPLSFLQEVLREFPTDFQWLVWGRSELELYNKNYQRKLKAFDWEKKATVTEVSHFPEAFAERLIENGDRRLGTMGVGSVKAISFADFRKHLIRFGEKVFLVKLDF